LTVRHHHWLSLRNYLEPMMASELTPEQVSEQAMSLHSYVARGGEIGLWFASKYFTKADEDAIRREYTRRVRSCGWDRGDAA